MRISVRLLLGYFLIVGLAAWFVLNVFISEVKPGVRQTMEDTLVDTAYLLAELAAADMREHRIADGAFAAVFERYRARNPHAYIWGIHKESVDLRTYVTDDRGVVIYDSAGEAVGRDYSRWNDVYLTLRGQYGVRSTLSDPDDESSSVMHVAAPIMDGQRVVGVITVSKSTRSVQAFIDRSRARIERAGWWLMGGALGIGLLFTWWLMRSVDRLRRYARDVGAGRKTQLPRMGSIEFNELGEALAEMREKLDGREYVENYVHHLTHEMKSPLSALVGAAELLDEDMPQAERVRFTTNIREQSARLQDMVDRLLTLARLERRQSLDEVAHVDLRELVEQVIADHEPALRQRGLRCVNRIGAGAAVEGEAFLLRQALSNLLSNAIDFSPEGGEIELDAEVANERLTLCVRDCGPGIPDYALQRVFERFYSLVHPATQRKGTGLGLPFVREIALLHGGEATLTNREGGGAEARLTLPAG